MRKIKRLTTYLVGIMLSIGIISCSEDNNENENPENPDAPNIVVPLTQFKVTLGTQTSLGTTNRAASFSEDLVNFNNPKFLFSAKDAFTFSYVNASQSEQKAYAYTSDGKTWTIHEKEDSNSPIKTIKLDSKHPTLSANYLSAIAIAAGADKDGIVAKIENGETVVGCFDALSAIAEVTIKNNQAHANIPFQHVNHLLSFHIKGTTSEEFVKHLKLNVAYSNAAGIQQNAVLYTSSKYTQYTDVTGTKHTVFQAIVPRNGTVKAIQVITNNSPVATVAGVVNIDCVGGKSHLVTLNVNNENIAMQVGAQTNGWAEGGEMNPDGSPVGDILIGTADELRILSEAVSKDPSAPAAKINGVLAYTGHVIQTANIDLSQIEWRPIGGNTYLDEKIPVSTFFAGTYNGNGFKITGMKVSPNTASKHETAMFAGLFGNVESPVEGYAVLANIRLEGVDIQLNAAIDEMFVGALVGKAYGATDKKPVIISGCSVTGKIAAINTSGKVTTGGLVGEAIQAQTTGNISDVTLTSTGKLNSYAGGLIGNAKATYIVSSYAKGSVSGKADVANSSFVGGIAGALDAGNIISNILACSSNGDVISIGKNAYAGGLVGYNSGYLTSSYARGKATATGSSSSSEFGAIVGKNAGKVTLCYGVGEGGKGSSSSLASENNIVYNTTPVAANILSIVSGKAWKDAVGSDKAEITAGGVHVIIPINNSEGKQILSVNKRLWVLSNANVWSTNSPASNIYPLPNISYKGE